MANIPSLDVFPASFLRKIVESTTQKNYGLDEVPGMANSNIRTERATQGSNIWQQVAITHLDSSEPSAKPFLTQMSYIPPRGPCAHKPSLMTPTCTCLRFMIHPVKAASSFECDGCGHHASFHKMENRVEDETVSRWKAEEAEREREKTEERLVECDINTLVDIAELAPKRRRLAIVGAPASGERVAGVARSASKGPRVTKAAAGRKRKADYVSGVRTTIENLE